MQDVLNRHNFEYSIYGLAKIVGRANTRMLKRRQRQYYKDEGAFAVAVGMASPAARLRHFRSEEVTGSSSSSALLRTSAGQRQAGLLELDDCILVLVRSFLAAQRWTRVNVWKAHAQTTFDCDMAQPHAVVSASNDHTLKVWANCGRDLTHVLQGHTHFVTSCSFSPDVTKLLSASRDRSVKVWDVASGRLLHTLVGHTGAVECACFSPDGSVILSASGCTVKMWNVVTGSVVATAEVAVAAFEEDEDPRIVRCCVFSRDGTWCALGCDDWTVKLLDVAPSLHLQHIRTCTGHLDKVKSVQFCPRRDATSVLLSGSFDRTMKLWDSGSGRLLHTLVAHTGWIRQCCFSPSGTKILSCSDDKTVIVWNALTGQVSDILDEHKKNVISCAWSKDGKFLVAGYSGGDMALWKAT
jgi:WD40 repeat protein